MSNLLSDWCIRNNRQDLLDEWDFERNQKEFCLEPDLISYSSSKKVYWRCKDCGNEFFSLISNRTGRNSGCPLCGRQKRIEAYKTNRAKNNNALEFFLANRELYHTDLEKEWDVKKNLEEFGVEFKDVAKGSHLQAYWVCEICGESFQQVVKGRLGQFQGCLKCSIQRHVNNQKIKRMESDGSLYDYYYSHAKELKYNLIEEWDVNKNELTPKDVCVSSSEKVWWKCSRGHSWQAPIGYRAKGGFGCRLCGNGRGFSLAEKLVFSFVSDFFPDAVPNYRPDWLNNKELDIFIPSINVGIEYDGSAYHSDEKDLLKNEICKQNNVTLYRLREKDCSNLNSSSIDIALDGEDEESLVVGIEKLLHKLGIDGVDTSDVFTRRCKAYNDAVRDSVSTSILAVQELADAWDYDKNEGVNPATVSSGSGLTFWWKCEEGHSFSRQVIAKRKIGCPICSNRVIEKEFNDIKTLHPDMYNHIFKEWMEEDIDTIGSGGISYLWWKCDKGHKWRAKAYSVLKEGQWCPYCHGISETKPTEDVFYLYASIFFKGDAFESNVVYKKDYVYLCKEKVVVMFKNVILPSNLQGYAVIKLDTNDCTPTSEISEEALDSSTFVLSTFLSEYDKDSQTRLLKRVFELIAEVSGYGSDKFFDVDVKRDCGREKLLWKYSPFLFYQGDNPFGSSSL